MRLEEQHKQQEERLRLEQEEKERTLAEQKARDDEIDRVIEQMRLEEQQKELERLRLEQEEKERVLLEQQAKEELQMNLAIEQMRLEDERIQIKEQEMNSSRLTDFSRNSRGNEVENSDESKEDIINLTGDETAMIGLDKDKPEEDE